MDSPEEKRLTVPEGGVVPVWPVTAPEISIAANGVEEVALAVAVRLDGVSAPAAAMITVVPAVADE